MTQVTLTDLAIGHVSVLSLCVSVSVSVSVYLCLSLSVSVGLCLSLSLYSSLWLFPSLCLPLCVRVCSYGRTTVEPCTKQCCVCRHGGQWGDGRTVALRRWRFFYFLLFSSPLFGFRHLCSAASFPLCRYTCGLSQCSSGLVVPGNPACPPNSPAVLFSATPSNSRLGHSLQSNNSRFVYNNPIVVWF